MRKIIAIFVFIFMAATLASCTAKNQEQAVETALEENTVVIEETVSVAETAKEQAPTTAAASSVQAVTSQEGTASSPSEVVAKPTDKEIQAALKNAGLYNGSIDGVIGKRTKKAIEDFQSQNNLVVDGKVGLKTWDKLKTYLSALQANATSD
ncbi:MAG: hypothetical protein FJZ10_05500 [Candidatus Omnitrophica bacterium]|nr:hypothetical protein [Candidatus Omnitrophota bacterium]